MTNPISDFWSALAPRERLMITGGAAIIAVTIIYLLFSSVLSERSSLKQEIAAIENEMKWMTGQAELLSRLSNSCQQNQIAEVRPADFISRQAERNSISLNSVRGSGQGSLITGTAADGNAFLRYSHQLVCQGYSIDSFTVSRTEESAFQARIEVNHGS